MPVVAAHPARCACCRTDGYAMRLRRDLTAAETHLDLAADTHALDETKRLLAAEIVRVQRLAARARARGRKVTLEVTPRMLELLAALYEHGRRAAMLEAASLGVDLEASRLYAAGDGLERPLAILARELAGLSSRIETRARTIEGRGVALDIADVRAGMLERLAKVPGALNAAGQVVSTTLASGLGDVFSANAHLFGGWQYSAVMDGGTCPSCAELDGTIYETWDAIQEVLPDGGPNPECDGGDRCRCRAVGLPPEGTQTTIPTPPPIEPPPAVPEPPTVGGRLPFTGRLDAIRRADGTLQPGPGVAADHALVMSAGEAIQARIDTKVAELFDERVKGRPGYGDRVIERQGADIPGVYVTGDANVSVSTGPSSFKSLARLQREWDERHGVGMRPRTVPPEEWNRRGIVRNDEIGRLEREAITEHTGGRVTFGQATPARVSETKRIDRFDDLVTRLPDRWVEAHNAHPNPLIVRDTTAANDPIEHGMRAYHHAADSRGANESLLAMPDGYSPAKFDDVVLHEMVHRIEASVPELRVAEWAYHELRARGGSWTGAREAAQEFAPGEWAVEDKWREWYSGRDYNAGPRGRSTPAHRTNREVATMGIQGLFGADQEFAQHVRLDADYRRWVLGVIATLG